VRVVGVSLKNYFGYRETLSWLGHFVELYDELDNKPETTFVLPADAFLGDARNILSQSGILYGTQDVSVARRGPFTGECFTEALAEMGCAVGMLGHWERVQCFGEDVDAVVRKFDRAIEADLIPIVCVGETERCEREVAALACAERVESIVSRAGEARVIIAYEPVWCIGAREWAPPEHVLHVVGEIKRRAGGVRPGGRTEVIYGGSVGRGWAQAMAKGTRRLSKADPVNGGVDGIFLGRSAHDPAELRAILHEVGELSAAVGW